jgi:hypothetical protein
MIFRVILSFILLFLVFFLPWWANVILIIALAFYFKNYYEAVILGLIMDAIYGSFVVFDSFIYMFTISFLIMIYVVNKIREKMIMY